MMIMLRRMRVSEMMKMMVIKMRVVMMMMMSLGWGR